MLCYAMLYSIVQARHTPLSALLPLRLLCSSSPSAPRLLTSPRPRSPPQAYPNGLRHIRADGRVNEWKTPRGRPITVASANRRQVAVALQGGEIMYFELDAQGSLAELDKKELGNEVSCLEVGSIPDGRQRSRFLAVGGWDNTIRVLSLDPDDCMTVLAVLALPSQAESAAVVTMPLGRATGAGALFLCIGLHNGVMLRARLDARTGQLSDTRTRFLGARPVKLFRMPLGGNEGVLALSSRPWAVYCHQHALQMTPLSYDALEYGSSFTSEHCGEGLVAVAANTLRILSLEKLGDAFNAEASRRAARPPARRRRHQHRLLHHPPPPLTRPSLPRSRRRCPCGTRRARWRTTR